jgi:hypothetical protein
MDVKREKFHLFQMKFFACFWPLARILGNFWCFLNDFSCFHLEQVCFRKMVKKTCKILPTTGKGRKMGEKVFLVQVKKIWCFILQSFWGKMPFYPKMKTWGWSIWGVKSGFSLVFSKIICFFKKCLF